MNYKVENVGPYNIHTINTKKFNTITVMINFRDRVEEVDLVYRNLLTNMFVKSSKKYPSTRLLSIKSEELYDVDINFSNDRMGNFVETVLKAKFLNPKLTNKNMLEESLKFIFEIIFNPNVENNSFVKSEFDLVYKKTLQETSGLKEDMRIYSIVRMMEELGSGTPISYNIFNKDKILNEISSKSLYEYYENMIKTSLLDIYILGDINEEEVVDLVKSLCPVNTIKKDKKDAIINHESTRSKIRSITEVESIKQAKLTIGCKTNDISVYERLYVMPIFNEIYGGSSDAKLFKNIREEHSLAYYIYSVPRLIDNMLYIYCGIDDKDISKVTKLVKKNFQDMKNGKFSDDDIKKAKINYEASLKNIEDSPISIINTYYSHNLIGSDLLEDRYKKIQSVTSEEVATLANKIHFDTSFVVRGNKNEGN